MKILFVFIAVLGGMLTASVIIFGVEYLNLLIYPFPNNLDINNQKLLMEYIKTLPAGAFIIILTGYILGSFAGGIVSTFISGRVNYIPAIVVGAILTSTGMSNPDPTWFSILSALVYIPCALLGFAIAKKKGQIKD
jgi:hypothetical protein